MEHNQEFKNNELPAKKKRKKILFWSIGSISVLLLIAAVWFFNLFSVHAYYYYLFKTERIPGGASLYASEETVNYGITSVLAMRMIRPMTVSEVEGNVLYSEAEKVRALRIANDSSLKPYLKRGPKHFF